MESKPMGAKQRSARPGQSAPTIADVAKAAGVSPMTVSRVINSEASVIERTREKVQAAIEAIGYRPNAAARTLAGGQQCRIALLYSNPSAGYLSELLVGSLAEAKARNVELTIEPCDAGEAAAALVQRIRTHRINAVLLPPPLCDDAALLAEFHAAGLPVAQVASGAPDSRALAVTIDDEAAAHAMTTRLIGMGHRTIAFITGADDQTASALRRTGHIRALTEAGIVPAPELFASGDFSYRSGLAAAERLLACETRPTAIAAAHRAGMEVPRDISICGYDDTAIATAIWPELTTIRQPVAEMARCAVRLLSDAVRSAGNPAPRHERLDFQLVPRDSDTVPPRSERG
jgi:LacI family transcriptional regulator